MLKGGNLPQPQPQAKPKQVEGAGRNTPAFKFNDEPQPQLVIADTAASVLGAGAVDGIVTLVGGQPVTTTLAIAEGTELDHATVIKLVRTYLADLEEFGGSDLKSDPLKRPEEFSIARLPPLTSRNPL